MKYLPNKVILFYTAIHLRFGKKINHFYKSSAWLISGGEFFLSSGFPWLADWQSEHLASVGYLGYSKRAAPRDVISGSMGGFIMALDLSTHCPKDMLTRKKEVKGWLTIQNTLFPRGLTPLQYMQHAAARNSVEWFIYHCHLHSQGGCKCHLRFVQRSSFKENKWLIGLPLSPWSLLNESFK